MTCLTERQWVLLWHTLYYTCQQFSIMSELNWRRHFPVMWFWEVLTDEQLLVLSWWTFISITKTSSLFVINRGVLGMGPGESSWEGTSYGWLTGSVAGIGPKNTHVNIDMLFIGLTSETEWLLSSHCICHLPEVWDDTFYIMAWAMLISRNVKRCSPACNCKSMLFMRA